MGYTVIPTDEFERLLTKLARKYPKVVDVVEEYFLELECIKGNVPGDVIQGTGSHLVIKTRHANPDANRGKQGGFRIIITVVVTENEIYPLSIYSKNVTEKITKEEILSIINRNVLH
ncbi:hypothetical protein ACE1TF_16475 [Geomicrobium sp. JSM 1781026]|uniref:hypothetical protein n=1 Tax=Geomicrobium sp. JSM 1781026 TaxID=3344580 RepID=UPI0035C05FC6